MTHTSLPRLEIKSAPEDAVAAFNEFHRTFGAFRETNDERIAQIEQRLSADVVTEEKLARIDTALDDTRRRMDRMLVEKARSPLHAGDARDQMYSREHKAAFRSYMRSGEAQALRSIEEKAMSSGSGPDGGYLVPVPAESEILRRMANISPIRSIASVRSISTATFKKAFSTSGPAAGWVGEADPRPQSANQQIADMTFPAMELYAMPAATQSLLDDAVVDIEQWIAGEIDTVFAEQEGAAFVNGNGTNKPMGFLAYPKSTAANWAWGKTAYLPTGAAGAFAAANPSDLLVDVIYALRAGYRQNARFVMNRRTQAQIRKFKATTGEYLWAPPESLGGSATLMNFPIVEAEDMPDVATDSFAIAFGDFQRGYLVVDRVGIRILRDPYSAKPYVLFYTTKRVGGGIQDFDAIKLLKFGTT
ncbi:MAG: Phage major capsid protein family [Hyphomicrobiales bacterium]|nr:Phage major capsid protein family [Hyphomicrobiales bacterium]